MACGAEGDVVLLKHGISNAGRRYQTVACGADGILNTLTKQWPVALTVERTKWLYETWSYEEYEMDALLPRLVMRFWLHGWI